MGLLAVSHHVRVSVRRYRTWQLNVPRMIESREKASEHASFREVQFYNLISGMTHQCFVCVLLITKTNSGAVQERTRV